MNCDVTRRLLQVVLLGVFLIVQGCSPQEASISDGEDTEDTGGTPSTDLQPQPDNPSSPCADLQPDADSSLPPEEQYPPSALLYSRYELPAGKTAWVLQAHPEQGEELYVPKFVEWLDAAKYQVDPNRTTADLATLRSVQNAALLFIYSHGAYGEYAKTYGVMTANRAMIDSDSTCADLKEGCIFEMGAPHVSGTYWAITPAVFD